MVPLLTSKSLGLRYFVHRDLVDEETGAVEQLWHREEVRKIVDKQLEDGAWRYHSGREHIRSSEDYSQLETYRILRELVQKHGLNRSHPTIQRAAGFLFSHQTKEGDFRGILGNQYTPYYSAGIMELLIQAGYADDSRIVRGFRWLLSIRQDDGGWALPLRTVGRNLVWSSTLQTELIQPDKSKPFSHLITGMVLRAFAADPQHRSTRETRAAGELLASRFFEADKYSDRRATSFWTSFSYPFWFTDLLSSLDSLSLIGLDKDNLQIQRALNWFISRQERSGLWRLKLRIMAREKEPDSWITLAICRVFKRFYG
jgi:squalene-hopene cyclase-like protein